MSIYAVKGSGHGLVAGDLLFGGESFHKEGGEQFRFKAYDRLGLDKGMVHLPLSWLRANVSVSTDEPDRTTADERAFQRSLASPLASNARRPSIDRINLFFERNTAPRAPVDQHVMNYELFQNNQQLYFDEFKQRVLGLRPGAAEEKIVDLWDTMVSCFRNKDVALARRFLEKAKAIGLQPLESEGPRLFWSGKTSKEHAYAASRPPLGETALERTDIGQLLDKLSVFKTVPWELSTLLWALVSRYFGMGATGDVHVYLDGGFAMGNVFWNDELPMMRLMQRYGAVSNIILHIWHTRDNRWLPEFNIQSDKLLLVFDKAKRVPAPTVDNPDATRSFRFEKPIRVAVLRNAFERFLQSPQRQHPLVLYEFRKETCIFARPVSIGDRLDIRLFEYDNEAEKWLLIRGSSREEAFAKLPAIEKFLMANYRQFWQLPDTLVYQSDAFCDGRQILAFKGIGGQWLYREGFLRQFGARLKNGPSELGTLILKDLGIVGMSPHHDTRRLVEQLFDDFPDPREPSRRIGCLRRVHETLSK